MGQSEELRKGTTYSSWEMESSLAQGQFNYNVSGTSKAPAKNVIHSIKPVVTQDGDAGTQDERWALWDLEEQGCPPG